MPAMIDGAGYTVAGVRKPPRNELAGDGARKAPRASAMGIWLTRKVCAKERNAAGREHDATGRQQQLGLMVGTVAECGGCRLALMAAWRNRASVIATG